MQSQREKIVALRDRLTGRAERNEAQAARCMEIARELRAEGEDERAATEEANANLAEQRVGMFMEIVHELNEVLR